MIFIFRMVLNLLEVDIENYNKSFEELKAQLSNPDGVGEVLKKVMLKDRNPNEIGYTYEDKTVDNPEGKCFPTKLLRLSRISDNFCTCEQLIQLFARKIQEILSVRKFKQLTRDEIRNTRSMRPLRMGNQALNVLISIYPELFFLDGDKVKLATSNMKLPWSKEIDLQTVENILRKGLFSVISYELTNSTFSMTSINSFQPLKVREICLWIF